MHSKILRADFFWPLAVLTVVSTGIFVSSAVGLAQQFDEMSVRREQIVVENGWQAHMSDAARRVVPQVAWDDAVQHLDNHFDPAWAHDNIGVYLSEVVGISWSAVIDAADKPAFQSDSAAFETVGPHIAQIVAHVRQREAVRRAWSDASRNVLIPRPIQSSTLVKQDGVLQFITASVVQPDFGRAQVKGPRAPVVVTSIVLDNAFFEDFAARFLLQDLHTHTGETPPDTGQARISLRDSAEQVVVELDWTPRRPGAEIIRRSALPMVLVLAALAGAMIVVFRRSRRIAQGLIASESRASNLAYHDALTGLPNRVQFFDRLGRAIEGLGRTPGAIAVFCIDLDRFKEVNDTYGHQAGDELIKIAARRMQAACSNDEQVFRLSGDEFAIFQLDSDRIKAEALAASVSATMGTCVELEAGRAFVSCTTGVTLISDAAIKPVESLRQADLALYKAKESEKGWYCFFEPEMDRVLQTRRALEVDLREALAAERLEMVYQPQVNNTGVMTGVEALVRWRHPERGDISPAYFVPIAEECGLISELGMFTLRRAFMDSKRWGALKVAINVSASQLRVVGFVDEVADLANELGVNPAQFELEITEGILLGDDLLTHDTMHRLRALGFSLALDDFGTGYSSLSYLKRYPINKIKIDRSFVASLGVDAEAEAVVSAIVKLARALQMSVVAEGVETSDQRDRLASAGCTDMQGFLYGRPVEAVGIDILHHARGQVIECAA